MKYILIALLFCWTGIYKAQKADSIKSKWSDASQGKFIPSFWIDTLQAKPLNIKMKPRWRDSLHYNDTTKPIIDSSFLDWELGNCLVAHCTEDGCFSCDYKGHYYPYLIINDSIRKWFVKMDGNDSLFYYRHKDDTANYIWNGDKKDECGYDLKYNGEVVSSLCQRYNGKDTIQIIQQVWRSLPPNPEMEEAKTL